MEDLVQLEDLPASSNTFEDGAGTENMLLSLLTELERVNESAEELGSLRALALGDSRALKGDENRVFEVRTAAAAVFAALPKVKDLLVPYDPAHTLDVWMEVSSHTLDTSSSSTGCDERCGGVDCGTLGAVPEKQSKMRRITGMASESSWLTKYDRFGTNAAVDFDQECGNTTAVTGEVACACARGLSNCRQSQA